MLDYENLYLANQPFMEEYREKFNQVLKNGWFILGQEVARFEKQFATYCDARHCVGVGNGHDAIALALRAYSFKSGSEVIVPSNTYIATIIAVLNSGLTPVLVEPSITTYNLDPGRIEEAITSKTVAIIAVHLYGKCCSMDEIKVVASKRGLKIIEDCAQSHGATYKGRKAGTLGDIGAFSFYPTKNLGALGDGGALTTADEELDQQFKILRNYGAESKNKHDVVGINSRLDELQAAFLLVKLKSLDKINRHKQKLAAIYNKEIKSEFIKPSIDPDFDDVFHIYNIRHPQRDRLREYLLQKEIGTAIHYPVPPHRQKALGNVFQGKSFPISEEIHSTTLSLPISTIHSENDVLRVVEALHKF